MDGASLTNVGQSLTAYQHSILLGWVFRTAHRWTKFSTCLSLTASRFDEENSKREGVKFSDLKRHIPIHIFKAWGSSCTKSP
jgi:hypothetical protein